MFGAGVANKSLVKAFKTDGYYHNFVVVISTGLSAVTTNKK